MSGVPIGIVIFDLVMLVPFYKIIRASYAPVKTRFYWFLVALSPIVFALVLTYFQLEALKEAEAKGDSIKAMANLGGSSNFIMIFGPLVVYLLFKPALKRRYTEH